MKKRKILTGLGVTLFIASLVIAGFAVSFMLWVCFIKLCQRF